MSAPPPPTQPVAEAAPPPFEAVSNGVPAPDMAGTAAAAAAAGAPVDTEENKIKDIANSYLGTQVVVPMEEFAEDIDLRLGRANGNIYQRRKGIKDQDDGQVMVRLKKKRFIIIDYGIVPSEQDLQAAAMHPNINVPLGAGVKKCTRNIAGPDGTMVPCPKIGVPVLLHDSEPDQPASLYLRSGLCFTCQRDLNEKRRTQRKSHYTKNAGQTRKYDQAMLAQQHQGGMVGVPQLQQHQIHHAPGASMQLPGMQSVRIAGVGMQNTLMGTGSTGRVNATPHHRVLMAVTNGNKKIKLANTNQPLVLAPDAIILNGPPDNHSCKSVRTGHSFAEIGADLGVEVHQSLNATQGLLHSVNFQQGIPPPSPEEISNAYDQAFYSMSKAIHLLVQWKTGWDQAVASAMQGGAHAITPQHVAAAAATQQHSAAALHAASMANAAATAAVGGMIHGNPGSVPVGIPGVPAPVGIPGVPAPVVIPGVPPVPASDPAVAQAAAVAAVSQPPDPIKTEATAAPSLGDMQVEV